MRDHVLRTLLIPPAARGSIRIARTGDREWLIEMLDAFATEAGLPPLTPERARELVDERLAGGRFRIWNMGEDVAFAGFPSPDPLLALARCTR